MPSQQQPSVAFNGFNRLDINGTVFPFPLFPGKLQRHGRLTFKGRRPAKAQDGTDAVKEAAGTGRDDAVDLLVSQEELGLPFGFTAKVQGFDHGRRLDPVLLQAVDEADGNAPALAADASPPRCQKGWIDADR